MRKILQSIYKIKIFKRIIPSLIKIYAKIVKENRVKIKYKNIFLYLNLLNPIDREIFLKGNYEKKQIEYLVENMKKKKINFFIDIGAHMGFYSMIMSEITRKVFSFEPIKKNFEQLVKNRNLNNFLNIKTFNFALSNLEQEVEMWVPDKNKTGGYSIYDTYDEEIRNYDNKKINKIQSKTYIGDNIIKLKNEKIALKIDVERHEDKVLEGFNNLLKSNQVILQIELFEKRQKNIINYLKKKKFIHFKTIEKDFYFKNF